MEAVGWKVTRVVRDRTFRTAARELDLAIFVGDQQAAGTRKTGSWWPKGEGLQRR